ncbi:hypothetical protein CYMTET_28486 [Cymbomonas tetramitiformis]|uniref:Uncharacterized protein n=1 Tax=Cymbomonas tetramitiformis TaxID=36881 RepID=A0AAE0FN67_9CHLO|nr:hypothetical protein CYMTET_28486 [Cymbomonas tetramitiformis]|eukprot:gene2344-3072_t
MDEYDEGCTTPMPPAKRLRAAASAAAARSARSTGGAWSTCGMGRQLGRSGRCSMLSSLNKPPRNLSSSMISRSGSPALRLSKHQSGEEYINRAPKRRLFGSGKAETETAPGVGGSPISTPGTPSGGEAKLKCVHSGSLESGGDIGFEVCAPSDSLMLEDGSFSDLPSQGESDEQERSDDTPSSHQSHSQSRSRHDCHHRSHSNSHSCCAMDTPEVASSSIEGLSPPIEGLSPPIEPKVQITAPRTLAELADPEERLGSSASLVLDHSEDGETLEPCWPQLPVMVTQDNAHDDNRLLHPYQASLPGCTTGGGTPPTPLLPAEKPRALACLPALAHAAARVGAPLVNGAVPMPMAREDDAAHDKLALPEASPGCRGVILDSGSILGDLCEVGSADAVTSAELASLFGAGVEWDMQQQEDRGGREDVALDPSILPMQTGGSPGDAELMEERRTQSEEKPGAAEKYEGDVVCALETSSLDAEPYIAIGNRDAEQGGREVVSYTSRVQADEFASTMETYAHSRCALTSKDRAQDVLRQVAQLVRSHFSISRLVLVQCTGVLHVGDISLVAVITAINWNEAMAATHYAVNQIKELGLVTITIPSLDESMLTGLQPSNDDAAEVTVAQQDDNEDTRLNVKDNNWLCHFDQSMDDVPLLGESKIEADSSM